MKKKIINPPNVPKPIGPYNQGVVVGNLLYTAGQIAIDPKTGEMSKGSVGEQTEQVLTNLRALLEGAGTSLENCIKVTVFLKNMTDFPKMNEIYGKFFKPQTAPARSTIEAARLPKDALVEIEAVAVV